mgnify:CR=1 FL=1
MKEVKALSVLDDVITYSNYDPTALGRRLWSFPEQCDRAWKQVLNFKLPSDYREVDRVMLLGMGGSGIGGDLLADLASLEDSLPIEVYKDYDVPSHVSKHTLIIAASYSGNTTETISGFRRAVNRDSKIVAITSGGLLAKEAETARVPLFYVDYQGEARSALGYSFLVPLGILVNLGFLADKTVELEKAVVALSALIEGCVGQQIPAKNNRAKQLSAALHGKFPIIYGGGYFQGVARRWKTQFNENSKVWAQCEVLPEAHHNSVVGYALPKVMKDLVSILLLRPEPLHPSVALRYEVTKELLENKEINFHSVDGEGDNPLSQMLTTILLGDYTSYYLALLQGVDPSPVPSIDFIKDRLMG